MQGLRLLLVRGRVERLRRPELWGQWFSAPAGALRARGQLCGCSARVLRWLHRHFRLPVPSHKFPRPTHCTGILDLPNARTVCCVARTGGHDHHDDGAQVLVLYGSLDGVQQQLRLRHEDPRGVLRRDVLRLPLPSGTASGLRPSGPGQAAGCAPLLLPAALQPGEPRKHILSASQFAAHSKPNHANQEADCCVDHGPRHPGTGRRGVRHRAQRGCLQ
mmetsp:Transcript_98280/g.302985  ORF Transcript_98280/g.302985 Transcript_98280/m.302985 type:complete len:218 (+) Transcript_98280:67-720(+)